MRICNYCGSEIDEKVMLTSQFPPKYWCPKCGSILPSDTKIVEERPRWPTRYEIYNEAGVTPPKDFGQTIYENATNPENKEKTEKKSMSCSEAGRRGGEVTAAKYGSEHYQRIGRIGGSKVKNWIKAGKEQEAQDNNENNI